jgi:hypothetical protein
MDKETFAQENLSFGDHLDKCGFDADLYQLVLNKRNATDLK